MHHAQQHLLICGLLNIFTGLAELASLVSSSVSSSLENSCPSCRAQRATHDLTHQPRPQHIFVHNIVHAHAQCPRRGELRCTCCTLRSRFREAANSVGSALPLGPSCSSANSRLHAQQHQIFCKCAGQCTSKAGPPSVGLGRSQKSRLQHAGDPAMHERSLPGAMRGLQQESLHLMCAMTGCSAMSASMLNRPCRNARIMNRHCSALLT